MKAQWRIEHTEPTTENAGIPDVYRIYAGDQLVCELMYKYNEHNARLISLVPDMVFLLTQGARLMGESDNDLQKQIAKEITSLIEKMEHHL